MLQYIIYIHFMDIIFVYDIITVLGLVTLLCTSTIAFAVAIIPIGTSQCLTNLIYGYL